MPIQSVEFKAGGKSYGLRFTTNALMKLEEKLQKPIPKILEEFTSGETSLHHAITLLWAGLEGHRIKHQLKSDPYTMDQVGDIIDELGGFVEATELITTLLAKNFAGSNDTGTGKGTIEVEHPTTPPG